LLAHPEEIRSLAERFGTPVYLLNADRIIQSMDRLRLELARYYGRSEITYSVKTNYLSGILRRVLAAGYRLEVVSRHEMTLAESLGATPSQLLFNGPVKSADDLRYCYDAGIDVNLDSLQELESAAMIGTAARPFRAGLRVAATLSNGHTSRFGVDCADRETLAQLRRLIDRPEVTIAGLHLHHSSRRDAQSYCDRLDRLCEVAVLLGISVEYLDLGGGIASIPPPEIAARLSYPIDSHEKLASVVGRHAWDRLGAAGPRLILEPGIGVLADAMNYVTTVVALKPALAVCDGSMFDINPLRSSIHPPCHLIPAGGDAAPEATGGIALYGATCMEIDRVGTLTAQPRVGDLVVATNVGAYSASLAPEFIIPSAPVYSLESNQLLRCRRTPGQFHGAGQ
jgi:diaminopimelate decarboxylase